MDLVVVLRVGHPLACKVTHQQVDTANVLSHPFESNNQWGHCFQRIIPQGQSSSKVWGH